jgi:hypothetical protein
MISLKNARMTKHERAILKVLESQAVQDGTDDIATDISVAVKARTSGSSTLKPFGRRTQVSKTEKGSRVGTSWGPAVPVEFGTVRTPAHRIMTTAAEQNAGGARLELGGAR